MRTLKSQTRSEHFSNKFYQPKKAPRQPPAQSLYGGASLFFQTCLVDTDQKKADNFINKNKLKLHNFFKDRIPKKVSGTTDKPVSFSPTRKLEFRKEQDRKQSATKMSLNASVEIPECASSSEIKKLNETFSAKHGSLKLRNKFNYETESCSKGLNKSYQTATHSSLVKRSKTSKKEAYIAVFGDDTKVQPKSCIAANNPEGESRICHPTKSSIMRKRAQQSEKEKQKFRCLLKKIEEFSQSLNPRSCELEESSKGKFSRQTTQDDHQEVAMFRNEMVTCIQSISGTYKKKIENLQLKKINNIEDFDENFAYELKKHKNARLNVRNLAITELSINQENQLTVAASKEYRPAGQPLPQRAEQSELDIDAIVTITDRNKNTIQENEELYFPPQLSANCTMKQKLKLLSEKIVALNHSAHFFGVPYDRMYAVLWKERAPFELEGSYSFFKFIKGGNLSIVRNFVLQNSEYAHQIDSDGRSALVYAVQNNQAAIVDYLCSLGFNLDRETNSGTTALYYAIKNGYASIVVKLLRQGANPWSTRQCSLKAMLEVSSKEIMTAVKNARRVHMACCLSRRFKAKFQIWEKYRNLIQGDALINFS